MQLSSQQFFSIIESLRSDLRGGKAVEKRKNPRVGMRARATIRLDADASATEIIQLRDLSKSGLGFVRKAPLVLGERFTLVLPGEKKTGKTDPVYAVVQCRSVGDGFFMIGAALCETGLSAAT